MQDPLQQSDRRTKLRDAGIGDPVLAATFADVMALIANNKNDIEQAQKAIKDDLRDNFGDYVREWVKRNLFYFIGVGASIIGGIIFRDWLKEVIHNIVS